MTGPADLDLSGRWTGLYNYPGPFPPVSFEAELRELGGSIGGTMSEPDEEHGGGGTLHAVVDGSRQGSAVTFTKIYEDAERMPEPVFYSGTVQPDGNEISGHWDIPGHWSGTFLMVRTPDAAEAAEAQVGEEVEVIAGDLGRARHPSEGWDPGG